MPMLLGEPDGNVQKYRRCTTRDIVEIDSNFYAPSNK
jgi:hypothetical protein